MEADRDAVRAAFATLHVAHAEAEEELTILNPARTEVSDEVRAGRGQEFAAERNRQVDADCGAVDDVRRLVREARAEGVLPAEGSDG